MYELIPLLPLAVSSLEDLRYKAVPDSINYFMLIFTCILATYLWVTKHFIPKYITFSLLVLIFFFIMYLAKFLAIGDLFLMFWLFYYLGFFNPIKIIEFIIFTFLSGFIVANIYSIWILNKNKTKLWSLYISLALSVVSLAGLWYIYKKMLINSIYYFQYILLLILAFILFKTNEDKIKNLLVFKRKPNELVEGDWVCEPIELTEIPADLENTIKKYFNIQKENDKFLLSPKEDLLYGSKGLSKDHIRVLQKLYSYEKFKVSIKEGFPLVPAIFLGYLLMILC